MPPTAAGVAVSTMPAGRSALLGDIASGSKLLKRVDPVQLQRVAPVNPLLASIRSGVALKKVEQEGPGDSGGDAGSRHNSVGLKPAVPSGVECAMIFYS